MGRLRDLLRSRLEDGRELECERHEGRAGLLLAEVVLAVGAKDSARSHLTCRGGYQEPLGFSRVSTLSSTLSVLLKLVRGKGFRPPLLSLSLPFPLPSIIHQPSHPPSLAGQAGPPLHAPPTSATLPQRPWRGRTASWAAETWQKGWLAGPAGPCLRSHLLPLLLPIPWCQEAPGKDAHPDLLLCVIFL